MTVVGERAPGPDENRWDNQDQCVPKLFYIYRQWPYRFKRTVRLFAFPVILFRLMHLYRANRCEQILAVFPNEFYLFCGLVAAKLFRCPFYSYFHNTYSDNRSGIRLKFANWLQPAVFRNSRAIFVMSDGMKKVWESRYPNFKFATLVHSFHGSAAIDSSANEMSDSFRVAFMGNLNDSNRDAMGRMAGVLDRYPKAQLTTYSGVPAAHFQSLRLSGDRVVNTSVGYDQVVAKLAEADLLFLPHGFTGGLKPIEYATIFPTRTIPYLLSGVPIIAHSPPSSFLTQWLVQHDCAEVVDDPSVGAICQAIERLRNSPERRRQIVGNAMLAVRQFDATTVSRRFCDVVRESS